MKNILLLLMASSLFIGCATIGCLVEGCATKGCCVNKAVNNSELSEPKEPIEPTDSELAEIENWVEELGDPEDFFNN